MVFAMEQELINLLDSTLKCLDCKIKSNVVIIEVGVVKFIPYVHILGATQQGYILHISGKFRTFHYMINRRYYCLMLEKCSVTIPIAAIKLFQKDLVLFLLMKKRQHV